MQVHLTVIAGNEQGRDFVLKPGQAFLMGRGSDVTIRLRDRKVSRHHAEIELRGSKVLLTDLGSANGTYVDGQMLQPREPWRLERKQTLRLGGHQLRVDWRSIDDDLLAATRQHRHLDAQLFSSDEFELLDELGKGGMGRVWAARDRLMDREVAIKILHPALRLDPEELERFLREARFCCQVKSSYVVEVHGVRMSQGRPFIVMELVQGPSVKDRVDAGPLPILDVLRIGEDVARALEAAAQAGIVHRDIKPANILLSPCGVAKLTDFGIAKHREAQPLTETGTGLGSVTYMPPEQAHNAREADARADVYGLGATLYHLVAGEPPFPRADRMNLLRVLEMVTSAPPPPIERDDCPRDLKHLVMRMLSKDPAERPESAADVFQALSLIRQREFPESYGPDEFDQGESEPELPALG
jgi:serine/threonine protein kinase